MFEIPRRIAYLSPRVVRPLALPRPAVAVGGATMGGSGKTPLAIACAAELASAGLRTALIGHAYRAAPGRPRFVSPEDALDDVGDEALVAASALRGFVSARVVVAPGPSARASAIAFAAGSTDVLVLDGVGQTRPERAALALLAVDGDDPWGGWASRPWLDRLAGARRGALAQAPIATLVSACDAIVPLFDAPAAGSPGADPYAPARFGGFGRPVWPAFVSSRGAWVRHALLTWEALRSRRLGLITALARPERIVRALERRGVVLRCVVSARDHGPLGSRAARRAKAITSVREVDLWVATAKCALHAARVLSSVALLAPLATLDQTVTLDPELRARLRLLGNRRTLTGPAPPARSPTCRAP
jgi:tetraacyldisaccharide-1-P 4'-kinase